MDVVNDRIIRRFAPGRINLIGEHTDYNEGWVLPAAISLLTEVTLKPLRGEECVVTSATIGKTFSFDPLSISASSDTWENYIKGITSMFIQAHGPLNQCFELNIRSNIPVGAGVSSSAALECAFLMALADFYNLTPDIYKMIDISSRSNHEFIGINSGIMDQFASLMGKEGHFILIDCRNMDYSYIRNGMSGYDIILLNTNITHNLADSEYNNRRSECDSAIKMISETYRRIENFRELSETDLGGLESVLPPILFRRVRHVVSENQRVLQVARLLESGDVQQVGKMLYASHRSLSRDYDVSCPQLDFLVDEGRKYEGVAGSRMMGGGFGGCTINIILASDSDRISQKITSAYKDEFGHPADILKIELSDGALALPQNR